MSPKSSVGASTPPVAALFTGGVIFGLGTASSTASDLAVPVLPLGLKVGRRMNVLHELLVLSPKLVVLE